MHIHLSVARSLTAILIVLMVSLHGVGCGGGRTHYIGANVIPLGTNRIILVRSDKAYGAFHVAYDSATSRAIFYACYRTDGMGLLADEYVEAAKGYCADGINFGPFSIGWTKGDDYGNGWVYLGPDGIGLCVTDLTSWKNVDASRPKWVYKSYTPEGDRVKKENNINEIKGRQQEERVCVVIAIRELKEGHIVIKEDLAAKAVRAAPSGAVPKDAYIKLVGFSLLRTIRKYEVITWNDVKPSLNMREDRETPGEREVTEK